MWTLEPFSIGCPLTYVCLRSKVVDKTPDMVHMFALSVCMVASTFALGGLASPDRMLLTITHVIFYPGPLLL